MCDSQVEVNKVKCIATWLKFKVLSGWSDFVTFHQVSCLAFCFFCLFVGFPSAHDSGGDPSMTCFQVVVEGKSLGEGATTSFGGSAKSTQKKDGRPISA